MEEKRCRLYKLYTLLNGLADVCVIVKMKYKKKNIILKIHNILVKHEAQI